MSASIASKNMFDPLGNDIPEEEPPTRSIREVVKPTTTSKKREEKIQPAPEGDGFIRGNGRGGKSRFSGNEAAYRDREAGRDHNRSKNFGDEESAPRGGRGRGRGGRGHREFDRRSGTGREDSEKQIEHGWGANKGESELNDETAGAEAALNEASGAQDSANPNASTDPDANADANADAAATVEEDKTMTYDAYLAEKASRQPYLGPPTEIRRPNEGTDDDKKWANAKPLSKGEGETAYISGETKDKARNRERKTKQVLEIEARYVEPRENRRGGGDRGGRGRGDRGGRGRGDRDRGPRGDRGERGERWGGDRFGDNRGGNRDKKDGSNVNINDSRSFPALGA